MFGHPTLFSNRPHRSARIWYAVFRGLRSDHRNLFGGRYRRRHFAPVGRSQGIGITSLTTRLVCEKRSAMNQHNDRSGDPKPVIELGRDSVEHVELTTRALHLRIRQQKILAELGVLALQGTPFLELLNQTARLTAEGMEAQFCK